MYFSASYPHLMTILLRTFRHPKCLSIADHIFMKSSMSTRVVSG